MSKFEIIEIVPTLTTDAYGATDVLFATKEMAKAVPIGKSAILRSIVVLDKDDNAGVFNIIILRTAAAIGTVNAVYNASDAIAEEYLTIVPIVAANYVDLINHQLAIRESSHAGMGVVLRPTDKQQGSLWIAGLSVDTKTYSASGLMIKIGLEIQ